MTAETPIETASAAGPLRKRYTTVAIILHWLIAAAILFQIILGWRMGDEPKGPATYAIFQLHKSIGITILLLSLARLAWRLVRKPPLHPEGQARWETIASKIVHVAFYVIMIGLPITGWIMVSASKLAIPTLLYGTVPWPHLPFLPELAAGPKHLWHEIGETGHGLLVKTDLRPAGPAPGRGGQAPDPRPRRGAGPHGAGRQAGLGWSRAPGSPRWA
jgi:cytochrome b561